ncbi:Hypothetical protein CAP_4291 [Chondromyces apiculatus DSM 436]|uniref:Uncharacterized protein n=1 Tax=Chondromyces apiculatus DSM 436 TaxID=1192034 RepID=A0A017T746_9BACT|nr:Hypothetical protein CAP_4291 [Chondromyces apiculatus DSM 436]
MVRFPRRRASGPKRQSALGTAHGSRSGGSAWGQKDPRSSLLREVRKVGPCVRCSSQNAPVSPLTVGAPTRRLQHARQFCTCPARHTQEGTLNDRQPTLSRPHLAALCPQPRAGTRHRV